MKVACYLAALAGTDSVVVTWGLVLTHKTRLVSARRWRRGGGAGEQVVWAGAGALAPHCCKHTIAGEGEKFQRAREAFWLHLVIVCFSLGCGGWESPAGPWGAPSSDRLCNPSLPTTSTKPPPNTKWLWALWAQTNLISSPCIRFYLREMKTPVTLPPESFTSEQQAPETCRWGLETGWI